MEDGSDGVLTHPAFTRVLSHLPSGVLLRHLRSYAFNDRWIAGRSAPCKCLRDATAYSIGAYRIRIDERVVGVLDTVRFLVHTCEKFVIHRTLT
ncbi:MAG: hypothetical protein KGI98_17310 [Euryarchaeota archaeon]|nr:hypothetical protein [Euryarchaeota archaeon]